MGPHILTEPLPLSQNTSTLHNMKRTIQRSSCQQTKLSTPQHRHTPKRLSTKHHTKTTLPSYARAASKHNTEAEIDPTSTHVSLQTTLAFEIRQCFPPTYKIRQTKLSPQPHVFPCKLRFLIKSKYDRASFLQTTTNCKTATTQNTGILDQAHFCLVFEEQQPLPEQSMR